MKIRLKEFCTVAPDRHIAILSDAGGKWQGEEGIVREPGSSTIGDSYYQACRSPRVCGRLRPRSSYVYVSINCIFNPFGMRLMLANYSGHGETYVCLEDDICIYLFMYGGHMHARCRSPVLLRTAKYEE